MTSFSVTQKAFIVNSKWQVLAIKHSSSLDESPFWDFPGTVFDHNISLRNSLAKAVKLDTGLDLSIVSIPLNITTFSKISNPEIQIVRIIYLCRATGNLNPSTKTLWIDPLEENHYKFPDEGYTQAFKNYKTHSEIASEEFLGTGILTTPPEI